MKKLLNVLFMIFLSFQLRAMHDISSYVLTRAKSSGDLSSLSSDERCDVREQVLVQSKKGILRAASSSTSPDARKKCSWKDSVEVCSFETLSESDDELEDGDKKTSEHNDGFEGAVPFYYDPSFFTLDQREMYQKMQDAFILAQQHRTLFPLDEIENSVQELVSGSTGKVAYWMPGALEKIKSLKAYVESKGLKKAQKNSDDEFDHIEESLVSPSLTSVVGLKKTEDELLKTLCGEHLACNDDYLKASLALAYARKRITEIEIYNAWTEKKQDTLSTPSTHSSDTDQLNDEDFNAMLSSAEKARNKIMFEDLLSCYDSDPECLKRIKASMRSVGLDVLPTQEPLIAGDAFDEMFNYGIARRDKGLLKTLQASLDKDSIQYGKIEEVLSSL